VREAAVHPLVDPRETCGDLVDRAVEVVDSRLQRDGEVDEIIGAGPIITFWARRTWRSCTKKKTARASATTDKASAPMAIQAAAERSDMGYPSVKMTG